jgi:hypothetical protein
VCVCVCEHHRITQAGTHTSTPAHPPKLDGAVVELLHAVVAYRVAVAHGKRVLAFGGLPRESGQQTDREREKKKRETGREKIYKSGIHIHEKQAAPAAKTHAKHTTG